MSDDYDDERDEDLEDEDRDDDRDDDDRDDDPNRATAVTAQAVLEYLVRSLVADPDAVEVELDDSGRRITLNVTVADDDMGRVIGRRGRIANAIRTVVRAAASRDDTTVDVEFLD